MTERRVVARTRHDGAAAREARRLSRRGRSEAGLEPCGPASLTLGTGSEESPSSWGSPKARRRNGDSMVSGYGAAPECSLTVSRKEWVADACGLGKAHP